jgi:CubicO group peptidase (beta-lactamase class C family)
VTHAQADIQRGLAAADSIIGSSIGKVTPGAVLLVSRNGNIIFNKAYGVSRVNPAVPMRTTTMFDLASVTKVMATTFAVMMLVDRGKLSLDAPVHRYLPDFRGPHLDSITVRHLLQHSAGLVQWQPLYYQASNKAETYRAIRKMPLQWGVGEGRHYSDLSFMLMGYIVERVSGESLDRFVDENLYKPLGLEHTTFNPVKRGFTEFAETEKGNEYEHHMVYDSTFAYKYRGDPTSWNEWRGYRLYGEVDDGNSWYANGGVAGHAGLFSNSDDLAVLLRLLLSEGRLGKRYISAKVIREFFTLDKYNNYLGWQYTPGAPPGSFMHTGFTGTYVAGIPRYGLGIVLLTNRQAMGTDARGLFPDVGPLRSAVVDALVKSIQ